MDDEPTNLIIINWLVDEGGGCRRDFRIHGAPLPNSCRTAVVCWPGTHPLHTQITSRPILAAVQQYRNSKQDRHQTSMAETVGFIGLGE